MKNFKMIMSVTMLLSMSGACLNASDKSKKLSVQDQRVVDGLRSTIKVVSKKADLLGNKEIPVALAKEFQMAVNSLRAIAKKTGIEFDPGLKEDLINKNLVKKANTLPAMPTKTGTAPRSTGTGSMPKTAEMEDLTPPQGLSDEQKASLAKINDISQLIYAIYGEAVGHMEEVKKLTTIDLKDATLVNANYPETQRAIQKIESNLASMETELVNLNHISTDLLPNLQIMGNPTNAVKAALAQIKKQQSDAIQYIQSAQTGLDKTFDSFLKLQAAHRTIAAGTATTP